MTTCHRARRAAARLAAGCEPLEPRVVLAAAPLLPVQSLDGTGNNLTHPEWGSAGVDLLRRAAAAYADGISTPSGTDRPSGRAVSNALAVSPAAGIVNDRSFSAFVYAWGQFLDHDLSLTESAVPRESLPIAVPTGDPSFDPAGTGTKTIPMSRSSWNPATGVNGPREQLNAITAFIDGSQIYGSDATRSAALREFVGGRLRTSTGALMPLNTGGLANANDAHRLPDDQLYVAGDVRANENPELIALHTLFVREHNRLAAEAARRQPGWNDEQLFQHARRLVIAELQRITFAEFLPALLGSNSPAAADLRGWSGYRADVNPGIANEFSTAAFRFGHSMLGDDIAFLDDTGAEVREPLGLRDAFFNAAVVAETGIDPILKYLASDRAQEIDTRVVDDVRDFLFGAPGQGGFDLAALNIQRGRDHGLADYNTIRVAYGLPIVSSFADITSDVTVQAALASTYGSVDRVDLWVAGLAERHLPGSSLGETFTRILVDQFTRLRDGDRYWYRNVLSASAVRDVERTTLADVIRRNTGLRNLQADVFFFDPLVGGTAFVDVNGDGRRQAGERPLAGATVAIVDAAGVTVATTQTDGRGGYAVRGLDLGTYRVVVTPPGGMSAPGREVAVTSGAVQRNIDVAVAARRQAPRPGARSLAASDLARAALVSAFAELGAVRR